MGAYRGQQIGFFKNQARMRSQAIGPFNPLRWRHKLKKQIIISGYLLLFLTMLKIVDTPLSQRILTGISQGMNYTISFKEGVALVGEWSKKVLVTGEKFASSFMAFESDEDKYILPVQGEVVAGFQEKNPVNGQPLKGIYLEGKPGEWVVASREGVVVEVSSSQALGHYIVIKHPGEYITVYKHLEKVTVPVNTKVVKGETIGESSGKLIFELWERKTPINPVDHIDENKVKL